MENNNFISKNIRELKLNDGSKIIKPDKILEEMWVFYSKLYAKQEAIDLNEKSFKEIGKKLNEDEKIKLDSNITLEEIQKVVKNAKNNNSPADKVKNRSLLVKSTKIGM